jgi:hypothetical protein
MRRLRAYVDASMEGIDEPLDRIAAATRAYLEFFAGHPEFVELFIQERAHFKDRKKPTYFIHREANAGRWREMMRDLIAQGRIRDMPVERVTEVVGDLLYGTMFTNYFASRSCSPREQAQDLLDVTFFGVLSESERKARIADGGS